MSRLESLKAIRRGVWRWTWEIRLGDRTLALMQPMWFREGAKIDLAGEAYLFARETGFGPFYLEDARGRRRATAVKAALSRRFDVAFDGARFRLRPAGLFTRNWVVEEEGQVIGDIRHRGIFRSELEAELPVDLSLEGQVFLLGLVTVMWRRATTG